MKKGRLIYIDVIRIIGMLLVVLAHSCASVISQHALDRNWQIANAVVVVTEMAVPLFFMVSGAMILNSKRTYSLKYLFKHRLTRILVPFIVWSVISAFANAAMNPRLDLHPINQIFSIYHQPVLIAYWFIYPLVTLYLLSPLLKAALDKASNTLIDYGLVLWFIFIVVLPAVSGSLPKDIGTYFDSYQMSRIVISKSIGYFILGYRVTQMEIPKHRIKYFPLNLFYILVLLAVEIIISFLSLNEQYVYLRILSEAILPLVTALVFLGLKSIEGGVPSWLAKIVELLAPLTYGVYLLHGIVIFYLQQFISYKDYWLVFGLTSVISLAVIGILHLIPGVKRIFT